MPGFPELVREKILEILDEIHLPTIEHGTTPTGV